MNGTRSTWDEARRIADELEPRIRLANTDVRERWRALQPRLTEIERMLPRSGDHARILVTRKLATVIALLLRLRDDVVYACD